jgi:short-chain fatty acids transporter
MLAHLSDRLAVFFRAAAPDPFVIAVMLTAVTFVLALLLTDHTLRELAAMWAGTLKAGGAPGVFGSDGVWSLLKFAMQMCLILVTGHVLASSPPMAWMIERVAAQPRGKAGAAAMVSAISCVLGVLNWGLGLIAGALLARRTHESLERRGVASNLGLLAAAGYTPLMVWHGGLSGSAPLTVTSLKDIQGTLGPAAGLLSEPIALTRTLFSPMNLVITGGLLVIVPVAMGLMGRRPEPRPSGSGFERGGPDDGAVPVGRSAEERVNPFPDDRGSTGGCNPLPHGRGSGGTLDEDRPGWLPRVMEETPIVNVLLAALIGAWAWGYFVPAEGSSGVWSLGLDAVNLSMLMAGLLLHGTPRRFLSAVDEAARGCGGIIVQFPLYAGIMAVMVSSGLARVIAEGIASTSSASTLPFLTFLAACVVNLFIPSGGGQWAVQGPIALQAAKDLGVDPARIVLAVAYGDQLTNMLQPFWALPLLAITRAKARDIIGYTAVAMTIGGAWIGGWILML